MGQKAQSVTTQVRKIFIGAENGSNC